MLAELLVLAPGGLEERALDAGAVEYVLYGAAGELPDVGEVRAAAGGRSSPCPPPSCATRTGRSAGRRSTAPSTRAAAAARSGCARRGASPPPRASTS